MNVIPRLLLYVLCLFLVMIVYTGQKHTTARDTLQASARMTARLLVWTILGFLVMLGLQLAFID